MVSGSIHFTRIWMVTQPLPTNLNEPAHDIPPSQPSAGDAARRPNRNKPSSSTRNRPRPVILASCLSQSGSGTRGQSLIAGAALLGHRRLAPTEIRMVSRRFLDDADPDAGSDGGSGDGTGDERDVPNNGDREGNSRQHEKLRVDE